MRTGKIHFLAVLAITAGVIIYIISVPLTRVTLPLALILAVLTFRVARQWGRTIADQASGDWNASFCLRVAAAVFWINLLLCAVLSFFEAIPCLSAIFLLFGGISVGCWGLSRVADRLETEKMSIAPPKALPWMGPGRRSIH